MWPIQVAFLHIIFPALQVANDVAGAGIRGMVSQFPSCRRLFSSGPYSFDPSGSEDPTGSHATAGLALTATLTHQSLQQSNVEITLEYLY